MRLINVETYELKDFLGRSIPEYAILYHTWEDEEVLHQDMRDLATARRKKGFTKIKYCCRQAKQDGWRWAWVDTCCIDKTSSAELSEAINSMFDWYRRSMVCYAYLSDVQYRSSLDTDAQLISSRPRSFELSLKDATESPRWRWFRRGWTLQELLAPFRVLFYSAEWLSLGTKSELKHFISNITGIPSDVLSRDAELFKLPVATRMFWDSTRSTTREEDQAYCLLGIFNVKMPLLYGEGNRAFERLQEEIMRTSEDHAIFLWGLAVSVDAFSSKPPRDKFRWIQKYMLAATPRDFSRQFRYQPIFSHQFSNLQLTSRERGLQITLPLQRLDEQLVLDYPYLGQLAKGVAAYTYNDSPLFLGILNCVQTASEDDVQRDAPLISNSLIANSFRDLALVSGSETVGLLLQLVSQPKNAILRRVGPAVIIIPRRVHVEWDLVTCFILNNKQTGNGRHTLTLAYTMDARLGYREFKGEISWKPKPGQRSYSSRLDRLLLGSMGLPHIYIRCEVTPSFDVDMVACEITHVADSDHMNVDWDLTYRGLTLKPSTATMEPLSLTSVVVVLFSSLDGPLTTLCRSLYALYDNSWKKATGCTKL
ncbi:Uu.00g046470.m01.CDS01 [Anthostomella pinea]|uniref:Uu.00g046470.m01.CDS01 n=1 Tax=Anthostomella pinea TaxID=933095 RepID=A0AAI8YC37_9PEZI|nr:Uu.00g046470.m01.CDS01 [Anthostomella pinea]